MKLTVKDILDKKKKKEKIVVLTAYDALFASLQEECDVDVLLVGDSLGMVLLGHSSTVPVTLRDMIHHTKAVSRGSKNSLIVADMPYGVCEQGPEHTVRSALRLIKEGGAHAVKIEGGQEKKKQIQALAEAGIPVMGHLGLTPQSVEKLGGYRVQGKQAKDAAKIEKDALFLEKAGAFSIVLECVPRLLAKRISKKLKIPTIGIGAGSDCDGQVLVTQDLLGMGENSCYRFVRQYTNLRKTIKKSIQSYVSDVRSGKFPNAKESF